MKPAEYVHRRCAAAPVVLSAVMWLCSPAAGWAKTEPGWILDQAHALLHYDMVYVTKTAILITGRANTWHVLALAPKWDAIVWNNNGKLICTVPREEWVRNGFSINMASSESTRIPSHQVVYKDKYGSYPALYMRWRGISSADVGLRSEEFKPKATSFTFVTITSFNPPIEARQLMSKFLLVPLSEGLPVSLVSTTKGVPQHLRTEKIEETKIDSTMFKPPAKGYKLVKDERDIWIHQAEKDKINDFAEMLGGPDEHAHVPSDAGTRNHH